MYNIRNQKIDFDYHPQYISEEVHNGKLARSRAQSGDLIMNIVGPPLGKLAIIPESIQRCNFNQAAVMIRPYSNVAILNQYLFFYLSEMSEINSIATKGSAGQANISLTQSQNMRIAIPPLNEIRRINEKIRILMSLIEDIENDTVELQYKIIALKSKILELAMQGKLVSQDYTNESAADMLRRINPKAKIITDTPHSWNVPYGWVIVTLKGLIDNPSSKKYQIFQSEIKQKGKFPVISQSSNFIEGYSDSCDKVFHPGNGIVIFGDHTKIVKFYSSDFIIGADGVKLIDWAYNKRFLFYLVKYVSERIPNKGYSRHFQYLLEYVVGLPPLREQNRIVAKIEELYSVFDEIETSLQF